MVAHNYTKLAMLVYKPKQHLKQQTGFNYLTNLK